jgi:hypothetical protein
MSQFYGELLPIGKDAKQRYVAKMRLKLITEDSKAADQLQAKLVEEKYYKVNPKETKTASGGGRFNQTFELSTEISPRPPKDYKLYFTATPPVRKKGGDVPAEGEFDPFGGLFGGFQ